MNFFERQKQRKKQQILNDIKNKQQMDEYRENQSTFGLGASAGKLGYNAIKGNINKQGGSIIANNIDNAINGTANYGAIGNYADDAIKGAATQSSSAVGNAVAKEVAKEATKEATKKIATEGIKKGLGKIAPIVGGAMSAKSAYDRASKGDYVGAGLDAVAGVASFIPGIGTVIAMGAQALNAMKDLKKADEMKAIAKSQEAIAENQASALGNLNDKKQEIKAQQADNLANAPMIQPDMSSMPINDTLAQTDTVEPMVMQPTLVEPHNIPAENIAQIYLLYSPYHL